MRRVILLSLLAGTLLALAPRDAEATEVGTSRRFGLGFALGSPTSLVGKLFLDPRNAIDFGVGFWGYGKRYQCWNNRRGYHRCSGFHAVGINADYLWQETLARGSAKLDWHIGVGGRLWIYDSDYFEDDNDAAFQARMPLGLDLTFDRPSFLEVFLEIAPSLYIVPFVDFEFDALIGARFYF